MKFSEYILESQDLNEFELKNVINKTKAKLKKLLSKKGTTAKDVKKVIAPVKDEVDDDTFWKEMERSACNLLDIDDPSKRFRAFKDWSEKVYDRGQKRQLSGKDSDERHKNWSDHIDRENKVLNKVTGAGKKSDLVKKVSSFIEPMLGEITKKLPGVEKLYVMGSSPRNYARKVMGDNIPGGDVYISGTVNGGASLTHKGTLEKLKLLVCTKIVPKILKDNIAYINRVWVYNNAVHMSVFANSEEAKSE